MTKQNIIYTGSLIGIFLVVVIAGRLIFDNNNGGTGNVPATELIATTSPGTAVSAAGANSGAGTASSTAQNCASALAEKTTEDNTQYATGTILAVFNNDVSFSDASTTLAGYGFSIEAGLNQNTTYPSYHLLTVVVPAGGEFTAICDLEADSHIHSASLNVLFSLHD